MHSLATLKYQPCHARKPFCLVCLPNLGASLISSSTTRWIILSSASCKLQRAVAAKQALGVVVFLQEPLGVIRATLEAVLDAALPSACSMNVYLCDDGQTQSRGLMWPALLT